VVGVGAGLGYLWRAGTPSPYWDEAVTHGVVGRSTREILDLVGNIDLVHAAYYLLVHVLVGADAGYQAIRLISVLAAAGTAAALVRLGSALGSLRVGAMAGALFAVSPLSTRYAQEARSYALVTLLATLSVLALVRACQRPEQRLRWLGYVALVVATAGFNVLSLLMIPVHAAVVAVLGSRPVARRWVWSAVGSGLLLAPFVVACSRQVGQVAWLQRPRAQTLLDFYALAYDGWLRLLLLALLAAGSVLLVPRAGRIAPLPRRLGSRQVQLDAGHRPALLLGLVWALVPPVLLWTVSQVHPLFSARYVLVSLPGIALTLSALAVVLFPYGLLLPVIVLAVGGLHMQAVYRDPVLGHAEDVRTAATLIQTSARPGDAVVFLPANRRVVAVGYPQAFRVVHDIALEHPPDRSATLFGQELAPDQLTAAIAGQSRIWVVSGPLRSREQLDRSDLTKIRILAQRFHPVRTERAREYTVTLFVAGPAARCHPASITDLLAC
jgi:mannosyltransferase